MALDFLLDVDLMNGEFFTDRVGVAGLVMEQSGPEIEGIGQAVGRVHTHDQRAISKAGEL